MKKVSLLIGAIMVCLGLTQATAQKEVTTIRTLSGFNAVNISGGVDLYVTQGAKEEVKIEAAEDIQKTIITEVHNGTLEIYVESNHKFKWGKNTMKAYVTLPTLISLNASGGSDGFSVGAWKVNDLKMNASGGSDIKFELTGGRLECNASGGADLHLKGNVNTLVANASGGSDVNAYDLNAIVVRTTSSGGSDVSVRATSELHATANGGSDIYYKGNPAKVNRTVSGGSDIVKKD